MMRSRVRPPAQSSTPVAAATKLAASTAAGLPVMAVSDHAARPTAAYQPKTAARPIEPIRHVRVA